MQFIIDEVLANKILNYLGQQRWIDVNEIIVGIGKLPRYDIDQKEKQK